MSTNVRVTGVILLSRPLDDEELGRLRADSLNPWGVHEETPQHLWLLEADTAPVAAPMLQRIADRLLAPMGMHVVAGTCIWQEDGEGETIRVKDGLISTEPFALPKDDELWRAIEIECGKLAFSYPASAWTADCGST